MKRIIFLLMITLLFPINVWAGIICNDGWESSCLSSGPGCCSHHGGVAGGNSYSNSYRNSYSRSYYNYSGDDYNYYSDDYDYDDDYSDDEELSDDFWWGAASGVAGLTAYLLVDDYMKKKNKKN